MARIRSLVTQASRPQRLAAVGAPTRPRNQPGLAGAQACCLPGVSAMAEARQDCPSAGRVQRAWLQRPRGFTLVELILVMLLLAIAASMVAPRMSSFFRGRALNFEARRMLSLTHYAQSRAVAEGVPVILWVNPRTGTYGVEVQSGHETGDDRVRSFTADPSLTLEAPTTGAAPVSEAEDEKFGLPEGLPVIRFNPDGFFDEISVPRLVIQQGEDGALELVQKDNRLGYELRPVAK